jgi:hypothetical protein
MDWRGWHFGYYLLRKLDWVGNVVLGMVLLCVQVGFCLEVGTC